MKTLETLFLSELADMYDSEHRLTRALPKMARAATHDPLKAAFRAHLVETKGHVRRLKMVFQAFGKRPKGKKCEATVGLLEEGAEIAENNAGHPSINAALISAAQKVEHYEIASHGCLRSWAELLGNRKAAKLLSEILAQEKAADKTLTQIALKVCNSAAANATDNANIEVPTKGKKGLRPRRESSLKAKRARMANTT